MNPPVRSCAVYVMLAALMALLPGTMPAADPTPAPGAKAGPRAGSALPLDELFSTLDKNHDGKISRDEAGDSVGQRFSQWDADGDGFATREEIHAFRLRLGIDDSGRRITGAPTRGPQRAVGATATVLKEPADWRLETMAVPPGFAHEVKLKGTEEIRFAPGMFDNKSDTYFTCVIALVVDSTPPLGMAELKDFLEKYYRGLSTSRAQRTNLKIDPAQMRASVSGVAGATNRFEATVDFFDSFSDGRKIVLNVEALAAPLPGKKQTCLILLVSPSAKDSPVWQTLRQIGKQTALALPASTAEARP